jgi:hypothetical protein
MQVPLEEISKLSAILGIFLIFTGVVKVYTYYKLFKVSILDYMELLETLVLFMDNLMAYILFSTLLSSISLNFFYIIDVEGESFNNLVIVSFLNRFKTYLDNLRVSIAFFGIGIISACIYFFIRPNILKHELWLYFICLLIGFIAIPIFSVEVKIALAKFYTINTSVYNVFFFILLATFIFFAIANAYNEAYKVKKKKYYSEMIFEFDYGKFKCTNDFYYIGKTKNYLFFYNSIEESSTIIPVSRLKGIINKV